MQGVGGRVRLRDTAGDHRRRRFHSLHRALGVGPDAVENRANLAGRLARSFGELAHLVGDDGKTASLLTGAGGFDGRVERQQVGLVGDLLDHPGHLADLAGAGDEPRDLIRGNRHRVGDGLHLGRHLGRHIGAIVGAPRHFVRTVFGRMHQSVHHLDACRNVTDRRACVVDCTRLHLGGEVDLVRLGGKPLDARLQPAGIAEDGPQHVLEAVLHVRQHEQHAVLVARLQRDRMRQVAIGDPAGRRESDARLAAELADDALPDQPAGEQQHQGGPDGEQHTVYRFFPENPINVVNVDSGPDDPAPGLELPDIGELGEQLAGDAAAGNRLGPQVLDIAIAGLFDHLVETDEQILPVDADLAAIQPGLQRDGLVEASFVEHLAIEGRHRRMHHHPRHRLAEIVDPEVLGLLVAQALDHRYGPLLRFVLGEGARLLQAVIVIEDADRRLDEMPGLHLPVAVQQAVQGPQALPDDQQHGQQGEDCRQGKAVHQTEPTQR